MMLTSCDNGNQPTKDTRLDALDPYLVWHANLEDVQKHIEAKSWWKDGNTSLEWWQDMGWHKWYWVADSLTEQYLFQTNEGRNLEYVQCYCYDKSITVDVAKTFLENQGYIFLKYRHIQAEDTQSSVYASPDKQTRVLLIPTASGYWYLHYEHMPDSQN